MKKRFFSNWAILLSSALVFFVIPFFLNSGTALAVDYVQPGKEVLLEGEWIDRAHIKITKFEFTDDSKLSDEAKREGRANINARLAIDVVGKEWTADNISADEGDHGSFFLDTGCGSKSKLYTRPEDREPNGKMRNNVVRIHDNDLRVKGTNQNCVKVIGKVDRSLTVVDEDRVLEFYPNNFDNANIWYQQKSGEQGTLERVDRNSDEEVKQDTVDKLVYNRDGPRDCKITVKFIAEPANGNRNVADYKSCAGTANEIKAIFVKITKFEDVIKPPTPNDSTNGAPDSDCEVQLLNPLTWLMCPLIEGATLAVAQLDSAITSQLTVQTGESSLYDENGKDPNDPTKPGPGQALFNTWASFRYISLGVLVIVGLVMIISQALSFGIFDAYTIKKILPKILIGVIGISISWYVCKFLIDLFNDLGVGVRSLLYGPFKNMPGAKFDAGAVTLLGFGTAFAFVGLGVVGVLSFAATALLAVLIAFGILVFRQIVILLLVVTAPLAIVCWILPNTEKVWKMWSDFFMRALVVFPIIALFIAGGRVIAQIATSNTSQPGQSNILGSTVAFIAYFGPYFALPAAFRLAGGAIATVGGLANDRSRGVFDRLKKGRQERFSDRISRAQNEKLYNPNNAMLKKWTDSDLAKKKMFGKKGPALGKVFNPNTAATWVAAPGKNAQYATRNLGIPGLSKAGQRLESGIRSSVMDESEKWLQHVNKHAGANDKFYRAMGGMYSGFEEKTQQKLVDNKLARWETDPDTGQRQIKANRALTSEADMHTMATILGASESDSEQKAAAALHENAAFTAGMYADKDMNYASTAVGSAMGLAAHNFFNPQDAEDAGGIIQAEAGGDVNFAHSAVVQAEAIGSKGNPDVKPGYGHVIKTNADGTKRIVSGNKDAGRSWGALETFSQGDFAGSKSSFYKDGRTGGKIKELLKASGHKGVMEADKQKRLWRQELAAQGVTDTAKQDAQINKRLSQANSVIGELQQVAGPYSQAPIDSRSMVEGILQEFNIDIPGGGGVDPNAARGGGGGGGGGGGPVAPPSAGSPPSAGGPFRL